MNTILKSLWMILALLFLLNAFDALVFGLSQPIVNPSLNTLTDRVARAFISMVIAGAILFSVQIVSKKQ